MANNKVCPFESGKIPANEIDYKNLKLLKKFVNNVGKIVQSRVTGNKKKYQHKLAKNIKLARYLALLPYCDNHR